MNENERHIDDVFEPMNDPRRDCQAVADNARAVARQVGALVGTRAEAAQLEQITCSIQTRRADKGDRQDIVWFETLPDRRGDLVPIVTGELLVRDPDDKLRDALTRWSFGKSRQPIEQLPGLHVFPTEMPVAAIDKVARFVRERGFEASVNYVTPLRPVVKGSGGPEPSTVEQTFAARQGDGQVAVAVVDTGVAPADQRDDGWLADVDREPAASGIPRTELLDDFPLGRPDGYLDFGAGHGTFVAGVIAQVAPQAKVLVYRAIDGDGIGSEVEVARAILAAYDDGASIINLSLGAQTLDDEPLLAIEMALEWLSEQARDVLVVAAAGNYGDSRPCWPAASKRVVAVGALTSGMRPAAWSSRGYWVDCSCVGEGIVSTYVSGTESPEFDTENDTFGPNAWAVWCGTSFAAPQVAAAVARHMTQAGIKNPREALEDILRDRRRVAGFGSVLRLLPGT